MMNIEELLNNYIDENLHRVILSNAVSKEKASKVRIRPVLLKGEVMYQCTETHGPKEIHKNYGKEEVISYICAALEEDFRQMQLESEEADATVLVSKKGKMTVKCKKKEAVSESSHVSSRLEHNRKKKYILETEKPIPFLVDLGVMSSSGKIIHAKYDKFRQMNRYLEFIEDILPKLPKNREITIIDFGCGKSYLTFAMYYYLKILKQYDVKASFFVVGKEDDASMEMYQRIINEGHALGMHSFSHQYSTIYQTVDSFTQDLEKLQNLLKVATGKKIKLYRFPGGSSNKVSNIGMEEFIHYLNQNDIVYYDWNVSSGDATSQELAPEELVQNVLNDVKMYKNSVVLMHDGANKVNTVRALPEMIEKLEEMDVELLPITDETKPIQHLKAEEVD